MTHVSQEGLERPFVYLCRASGEGSHNFQVCADEAGVMAFYESMFGKDYDKTLDVSTAHFRDPDNWSNEGTAYDVELYMATFQVWKVDPAELAHPSLLRLHEHKADGGGREGQNAVGQDALNREAGDGMDQVDETRRGEKDSPLGDERKASPTQRLAAVCEAPENTATSPVPIAPNDEEFAWLNAVTPVPPHEIDRVRRYFADHANGPRGPYGFDVRDLAAVDKDVDAVALTAHLYWRERATPSTREGVIEEAIRLCEAKKAARMSYASGRGYDECLAVLRPLKEKG